MNSEILKYTLKLVEKGNYLRAGQIYLEYGQYSEAADCFEHVIQEFSQFSEKSGENIEFQREIYLLCARSLELCQRFIPAANYYIHANAFVEAAKMFQMGGDLASALKYFEIAGRWREAARLIEESGDTDKAREIKIRGLIHEKKYSQAANLVSNTEEILLVAEAYEQMNEFSRAARMYVQANQPSKAVQSLMLSHDWLEAAEILEDLGDFEKAAELREKLGEFDRAVDLYCRAEQYFKAGAILFRMNEIDRALEALQKSEAKDTANRTAIRNLIGLAYLRKDQFKLACDNYLQDLLYETVNASNRDIMYEFACALEKNGHIVDAFRIFERLAEFNQDHDQLMTNRESLTGIPNESLLDSSILQKNNSFEEGGKITDRYIIKEKIGSGGMGVVYRAYDEELEIEVALKVLKARYSNDFMIVQRFKQEVTFARQIHHENVVQLYDLDKYQNFLYITMEFFSSYDLKSLIRSRGCLRVDEAIPIMTQVCRGLWAAHQRGIVHRDIKPQNILINDSGMVKIVDFGIAIVMESDQKNNMNFVVGTPDYMSPEQVKGEYTDTRSDIYSFGTILYESIVGFPPFSEIDAQQIFEHHVNSQPIPPSDHNNDIPKWLNDLILKCLAKRPDDRYQSMQTIELQLATCGLAELMLNSQDDDDY